MKVQLIVVQGKPEGKVIPLNREIFRIGRAPECELRPNSDEISRVHAEFTVSANGVMLKDMGSRNGTVVNGKMLTEPIALRNGDLVQIAKLTFAVIIESISADVSGKPTFPTVPLAATAASLDEASNADIESWLVTDPSGQTPDRPSGVYGGDTITIGAYKASSGGSKPASPAASPVAAPSVAVPEAPAAQTLVAPAVPAVASADAPTIASAPAPAVASAPVSAAPPAAPAIPPPAAVPNAAPPAVAAKAAVPHPYQTAVDDTDRLPEGEGDGEEGGAQFGGDDEGDTAENDRIDQVPEDMMDETNPFFIAKKKSAEDKEPVKEAYKDSSDAASDILKKMLERRRAGRS